MDWVLTHLSFYYLFNNLAITYTQPNLIIIVKIKSAHLPNYVYIYILLLLLIAPKTFKMTKNTPQI